MGWAVSHLSAIFPANRGHVVLAGKQFWLENRCGNSERQTCLIKQLRGLKDSCHETHRPLIHPVIVFGQSNIEYRNILHCTGREITPVASSLPLSNTTYIS